MAAKNASIKMTEGPLFKKIFVYTLPIMFSGILQLLFNAADLIVVGQFCGNTYLAAVGATNSLVNLMLNFFIGLSLGAGIAVARSIGAGDDKAASKAVHTTIPVALICSVLLTVIAIPLSPVMLRLMDTPEDIIAYSTTYMQIYFSGTVFNLLYNFGSAILRATGDTRRPLFYLIIAGITNVLLNIFFVTVCHLTVEGVALATVISQAISAALVMMNLMRRTDICRLSVKKLTLHKKTLLTIIRVGIPSGIQSTLFSISNTMIQSSVNSFENTSMISGITAAASVEGFVYTSMNSFSHTTQNFVSQNYGAKKFGRILKVLAISVLLVTIVGLVLGVGAYLLGEPLLSIYIKDSTDSGEVINVADALNYGVTRLSLVASLYFLCGIMDTVAGAIRGLGASITPMIISLLGACAFRIIWIETVFKFNRELFVLYLSYPISWTLTALAQITLFTILHTRKRKREHVLPEIKLGEPIENTEESLESAVS